MSQSIYLQTGLEAVKAAETIIRKYLSEDLETELKDDLSPVTIADKEAEATIVQLIKQRFPDHTFFGEEGEKTDLANHHGFSWIIDPIDGTKNFIRKNKLFGTLLALMHDGELIVGISNVPLLNELMYAEKGGGAFLNGQPVHVSNIETLSDAYLSHGSLKYFMDMNKDEPLLQLAKEVRQTRGIGDLWSYHLLAQGKIEAMIEPYCKLWDIAAAKVIVEEAGGRVTQLDGKPVGPETSSILATNGLVHDILLSRFE